MKLIDRIKQSLRNGYNCDCYNPDHRPKGSFLGFVGAYIGCAISLQVGLEINKESQDEKKYCTVCHP